MADQPWRSGRDGGVSQAAAAARRRFTVMEYQLMGDSGILGEDYRVELIEGEIVEMSPIGSKHAGRVARAQKALAHVVGDRAIVWVQNPVDLDQYSEPEPDVSLLKARSDYYENRHPRPADVLLVVEVSDSSVRYDREVKLPLYARAGIAEVWIIDLAVADHIEVHSSPTEGGYRRFRSARRGEVLDLPGLADARLEVDALLG